MTSPEPVNPRLFTLEQANALLPFLERTLAELGAFRVELRALRKDIEVLSLIATSTGGTENPDTAELKDKRRRFRTVQAQVERLNLGLEETGCLVKHPDEGLVDFFSLRQDRLVFLCWKVGEPEIGYWHPLSGGYAARQALDSSG